MDRKRGHFVQPSAAPQSSNTVLSRGAGIQFHMTPAATPYETSLSLSLKNRLVLGLVAAFLPSPRNPRAPLPRLCSVPHASPRSRSKGAAARLRNGVALQITQAYIQRCDTVPRELMKTRAREHMAQKTAGKASEFIQRSDLVEQRQNQDFCSCPNCGIHSLIQESLTSH